MTLAEPTVVIWSPRERARALSWVQTAPYGTTVVFGRPRRSLPQNARLHAMCTDVACQVEWGGKKRDVEAWKDIFTAALLSAEHELDVVPGINGGFVLLGLHTSGLKKDQMSDLFLLIEAFCAEHGVTLHDQPETAYATEEKVSRSAPGLPRSSA